MRDMAGKQGKGSMPEAEATNVRRILRKLVERRYDNNMAKLGRALGQSGQSVSQILDNTNKPGWDTVLALKRLLGVSVDEILAGRAIAEVHGRATVETESPILSATASPGDVDRMAEMIQLRELPRARYPKLEVALAFYADEPDRWSPMTLLSARQGQFASAGCDAWTSRQWVGALDRLEAVVRHSLDASPLRPNEPPQLPSGKHRRS